jgi:hypothetical protein
MAWQGEAGRGKARQARETKTINQQNRGTMTSKAIDQELETIRKNHAGILRPADIVAFARDKTTALHSRFEWNNTAAAEAYRLLQAHSLIRVCVTAHEESGRQIRTYVSLTPDRGKDVGYRYVKDVLTDAEQAQQMIEDAKGELRAFAAKYRVLCRVAELAPVFAAVDQLDYSTAADVPMAASPA